MLSVILPRRRVVFVVVVAMVALVQARPVNSNSMTGCLINTFEVSAPSEVPVLAYISEASPAVVAVLYTDHNDADVRDAVTLTNTMAEHSKVRDRKSTKIPKFLSRQIPEGWNTFTLVVADGNLTIKLVLSEEDHVDLYTLALKDTVRKMHVEGNVSSCHQVSPEWHVKVGKEVTLLLQPKDRCFDQWVKVSPRGSAAPYVTFPTSRNTKTPIPADTTLRVAIRLRGTHALLRLFMHGDDDDDGKEIVSISVPVALPLFMVVGCRDGGDGGGGDDGDNGVHLRLMLSRPQPDKNFTAMNSVSPDTATAWITGTLVGSLAVVVVVIIVIVAAVDVTNLRPCTKRVVEKGCVASCSGQVQGPRSGPSQVPWEDLGIQVTYNTEDIIKEVSVTLSVDVKMQEVLDKLKQHATIEKIEAKVPEPEKFFPNSEQILRLPDGLKVNLSVSCCKEGDPVELCKVIAGLQPDNGYSNIDLRGCDMMAENWLKLQKLMDVEVKVKGRVIPPLDPVPEEERRLIQEPLPLDAVPEEERRLIQEPLPLDAVPEEERRLIQEPLPLDAVPEEERRLIQEPLPIDAVPEEERRLIQEPLPLDAVPEEERRLIQEPLPLNACPRRSVD